MQNTEMCCQTLRVLCLTGFSLYAVFYCQYCACVIKLVKLYSSCVFCYLPLFC